LLPSPTGVEESMVMEIRRLARGSLLGRAAVLARQVPERQRKYAQWYDWARRHVDGGSARWHEVAAAALAAVERGLDPAQTIAAARAAGGLAEAESGEVGPGKAAVERTEPLDRKHIVVPPPPATARQFYAGFRLRLAAYLIDAAVLASGFLALATGVLVVLLLTSDGNVNVDALWSSVLIFGFLLMWLYRAGMESSYLQGTVGKRVMGLAVVDWRGERISFGRATLRFGLELVSTLIFFLGLLMALGGQRRLTLHDHLVGTVVVRREYVAVAGAVITYLRGNSQPE
ncbi:MAG: RDD family protein, partial [Candidatus Dormibacteraceae bacterium]